jgi:hypothetical protein
MSAVKKKKIEPAIAPEEGWAIVKNLNKILRAKLPEFQRTETIDLPRVLPPAEELQDLKNLVEWCLKFWAEHDGFIFKPGAYYNE